MIDKYIQLPHFKSRRQLNSFSSAVFITFLLAVKFNDLEFLLLFSYVGAYVASINYTYFKTKDKMFSILAGPVLFLAIKLLIDVVISEVRFL